MKPSMEQYQLSGGAEGEMSARHDTKIGGQDLADVPIDPDFDDAMKLQHITGGDKVQVDMEANTRIVRRVDAIMLPLICLVFGLNFLDKTTLSYASVMGITKDINLTKNEYSWLGSIFYFGYLSWQFPAARLMQRFPLSKYLGINIILWGMVLSCMAAVRDFNGAVALRFFLGVVEASAMPGFMLLTSQWYTSREQSFRTSIWGSFVGFAQIFGGLVAYGMARGSTEHHFTMNVWKTLFLFTGLLTLSVGIFFLIFLPDNQLNAWWLTPQDRAIAIERVRCNQQGIGNRRWKAYQFREAFQDPMTWAFLFIALACDIPNGGITNFFSLLVSSFGYTATDSLLYGTPAGAVEAVIILAWGYTTFRWGNRLLWALVPIFISVLGVILMVALPAQYTVGRLVSYYLSTGYVVGIIVALVMISTNIAGYTKKTTVLAIFTIGYGAGNIIGPQTFRYTDAPQYTPAKIVIVVCLGLVMLDVLFIDWYYRRQNAKKAAGRAQASYRKVENIEWRDLTDTENPDFVYVL